MTMYRYTAVGTDGRSVTGLLPADNRSAAFAAVVGKGLQPVAIQEQTAHAARREVKTAHEPNLGRVSMRQVENFTRELASLLAGGVPLARGLFLLRRQSNSPAAQQLWSQIHDSVVDGTPLADALAVHPRQFSNVYVAMVRAGETGGFLDLVLQQIADLRTREQELLGKVKTAMVYPCVLATLAVSVLIFLMTFFIPKFSTIFSDFGGELPALTRFIMACSGVITSYGPFVAVAVVILALVLRRYLGTDAGKRKAEQIILSAPVLGRVVAFFAMVRFCRMLGTLLGAGVPLVNSLRVAKEAIGNQTLADTVSQGIEDVQRGESLARALGAAEKLFPPTVVEMIAIAEETGRLDKELVRLATAYEADLDRQLRMVVALAEPLMLMIMAALIGTVVVGMLLPIFNLQDLIK